MSCFPQDGTNCKVQDWQDQGARLTSRKRAIIHLYNVAKHIAATLKQDHNRPYVLSFGIRL